MGKSEKMGCFKENCKNFDFWDNLGKTRIPTTTTLPIGQEKNVIWNIPGRSGSVYRHPLGVRRRHYTYWCVMDGWWLECGSIVYLLLVTEYSLLQKQALVWPPSTWVSKQGGGVVLRIRPSADFGVLEVEKFYSEKKIIFKKNCIFPICKDL